MEKVKDPTPEVVEVHKLFVTKEGNIVAIKGQQHGLLVADYKVDENGNLTQVRDSDNWHRVVLKNCFEGVIVENAKEVAEILGGEKDIPGVKIDCSKNSEELRLENILNYIFPRKISLFFGGSKWHIVDNYGDNPEKIRQVEGNENLLNKLLNLVSEFNKKVFNAGLKDIVRKGNLKGMKSLFGGIKMMSYVIAGTLSVQIGSIEDDDSYISFVAGDNDENLGSCDFYFYASGKEVVVPYEYFIKLFENIIREWSKLSSSERIVKHVDSKEVGF